MLKYYYKLQVVLSGSQEVPTKTCVDMLHHANYSPYPFANTPPLTTHFDLNVCDELRRQCPWDDDRDGKEDDCDPDTRQTNLAGNSGEKRRY